MEQEREREREWEREWERELDNLLNTWLILSSDAFLKKRKFLTLAIISMTIQSAENLKEKLTSKDKKLLGEINGFLIRLRTFKNIAL